MVGPARRGRHTAGATATRGEPPLDTFADTLAPLPFGIRFYRGTADELVAALLRRLTQPFSYVVTPNVDHVVRLQHDDGLRMAYARASERVCDSRILAPLLGSLGTPVPEVIPGSDLTLRLLEEADRRLLTVALVGGSRREAAWLADRYPGMHLLHHDPPMGFIDRPQEVQDCLQFLYERPAHLVLLAVGCPRQEVLASRIDPARCSGVGLCIGASVRFAVGTLRRAPAWMQAARLEWAYRLLSEPRRLASRYLGDAWHILPIYWRARRQIRHQGPDWPQRVA